MTGQAELIQEVPEVKPPMPDLFCVSYQYCGPGWASGNWMVKGPFLSELTAKQFCERANVMKWRKRTMIWRLA